MTGQNDSVCKRLLKFVLAGLSPKRLGLGKLVSEHFRTLYRIDPESQERKLEPADMMYFIIIPIVISVTFLALDIRLKGLAEIIGGMAILTALLFGLLIHVFNVSANLRERSFYHVSDGISILLRELRQNISYACGVSLLLTSILASSAAFTAEPKNGISFIASSLIAGLFVHLVLTLLMVLNRVRAAFSELGL